MDRAHLIASVAGLVQIRVYSCLRNELCVQAHETVPSGVTVIPISSPVHQLKFYFNKNKFKMQLEIVHFPPIADYTTDLSLCPGDVNFQSQVSLQPCILST